MHKCLLLAFGLLLIFACTKPASDDNVNPGSTDTILSTGTFVNGAHATSGTAKLIMDKDGKRFLLLENFKSDKGPDVRIYLSTSLQDNDYTEITKTVNNGNIRLEVPTSAKNTQKYVLVWCEAFSILFDSAELK
jgi:hypothetical protein